MYFENLVNLGLETIKKILIYLRQTSYEWYMDLDLSILINPLQPIQSIYEQLKPYSLNDNIGWGETYDWSTACIRKIGFHPYMELQAVITNNHVVLLEKLQFKRHLMEGSANCVEFRPFVSMGLAVGCDRGICVWQSLGNGDECDDHWIWLGNDEMEYDTVVDIQWPSNGIYLYCILQPSIKLQVWMPDERVLMHQISLPSSCSNLWMLRNRFGFDELFGKLWSFMGKKRNILMYWERRLTNGKKLQTAAWTVCGSHLFFVPMDSCKLYVSSPNPDGAVFVSSHLSQCAIYEAMNFESVVCHQDRRECGQPIAITVDPYNLFMAVMFKGQPFVLLMLLTLGPAAEVNLKPLKFIQNDELPLPQPEVFATCISFSGMASFENGTRCLAIGWTNSYVQVEMLTSKKPAQVLAQLEEHQKAQRKRK